MTSCSMKRGGNKRKKTMKRMLKRTMKRGGYTQGRGHGGEKSRGKSKGKKSRGISKGKKSRGKSKGKKSRGKSKGKSKGKRPPSAWQKHLMKVFREMKTKDKSIKLGDAMRQAAKTYK